MLVLYPFMAHAPTMLAQLRLKWEHTWPGTPRDYTARDPANRMGYCRVTYNVAKRHWRWVASDGHYNLGTGYCDTSQEAARAAEAAYFRGERVAHSDMPTLP